MALTYVNLDPLTRIQMLKEFDADFAAGRIYTSDRLSTFGAQDWAVALRAAIESGSDSTRNMVISTWETERPRATQYQEWHDYG
jgi:hypothetical protein